MTLGEADPPRKVDTTDRGPKLLIKLAHLSTVIIKKT
jgi:hypothetical protein